MYTKYLSGLLLLAVFSFSCTDTSVNTIGGGSRSNVWLIPESQVIDAGPGKDGIPSIDNPKFSSTSNVAYNIQDDDIVVGVRVGDNIRGYPHGVLDWHEIVNDHIGNSTLSIIYCPLTGSATTWSRHLSSGSTTFGVSGLLFNSNLITYDRSTDSYWSQMMLKSVRGQHMDEDAELITTIETRWDTWKEMYPESKFLTFDTGFDRPYGNYPYGNYKTNEQLLYPVAHEDDRLHRKERIHGTIVGDKSRVFQIDAFPDTIHTINDTYHGTQLVTVGSSELDVVAAYERTLEDGTVLEFNPVQNQLPVVREDNEGTRWDSFGFAIEGPRAGTQLNQADSFVAYWFAWVAFYPGAEIHSP